jgi:allophanate hydrolase
MVVDPLPRKPSEAVAAVFARLDASDDPAIWTFLEPRAAVEQRARQLEAEGPVGRPLYGWTFAVKDNIHIEGRPTTAGCSDWAVVPDHSAPVVERLLAAGAILIGKTNLDQFATGLVGIRSPRGACRNALDPQLVPGGSSSGSAVAVARGLVHVALGTDTGGSGRVPAALNGVVGLKPSCGLVSSRGLIYANRSVDCVSVFAPTVAEAAAVRGVIESYDELDPFSRQVTPSPRRTDLAGAFRFAVPEPAALERYGDAFSHKAFASAVARLEALGGTAQPIPFEPFLEVGRLLFNGPWIVERDLAIGEILESGQPTLHPHTAAVLAAAKDVSAKDVVVGLHRWRQLRRTCEQLWDAADVLVVPTVPTLLHLEEAERDPLASNTRQGYYTYFANLLDLCAIALPSGRRRDGLPFGLCLLGRAFSDRDLAVLACRYEAVLTQGF